TRCGARGASPDLTGRVSGPGGLPRHIDWGPDYVYDLAGESDLALLYERVIREAQTPDDLVAFLDGATLRRLWPRLIVPRPARVRWEQRFEELTPQAVA